MFVEISGFLFLLIIVVLVVATSRYGYEVVSDLDAEATLQEISEDPQKFQTGTLLVIIEHTAIIALAVSLFRAFSPYNLPLGLVWLVSRSGEGVMQLWNKRKYWGLLNIARQYSATRGAENDALVARGHSILQSKNSTFTIAQLLFSMGTLAYSILFTSYGVIPVLIGWFGIVASILYGLGNVLTRMKPTVKVLWNLGGLSIWILELVLGGWLLLSSLSP